MDAMVVSESARSENVPARIVMNDDHYRKVEA